MSGAKTGNGLRTVVVGFGQIADGLRHDVRMAEHFPYATHAQVLNDHPGYQWLGVVDPSEDALAQAKDAWDVPHAGASLADVAREVRPEAAVIATPPGHRAEIVQQLPDLKAVMVEKPLGDGGDGAQAFLSFCDQRNIRVQVNYWRRGDRLFRDLASGGLADRIGRPQAAFATYGNGLYNNGSHMVDFIRMLLGEVDIVQALDAVRPAEGAPLEGDVAAPFALTLSDGIVVTMQPLDFRHFREVGLDVWGEAGRMAFYQEGLGVLHYPMAENRGLDDEHEVASDKPEALAPTVGDALYRLYDNLIDAVGGAALWSSGDQALMTEKILDAVLASSAEAGGRLHFR